MCMLKIHFFATKQQPISVAVLQLIGIAVDRVFTLNTQGTIH